jgi:transposase
VVLEAASLSEEDLGEFLRVKGLHQAQLDEWREQLTKAAAGVFGSSGRTRKTSPEAKRIRELEKELRRKDKALAETAALLVLKKKVDAIWGDVDDDTDPKNGR